MLLDLRLLDLQHEVGAAPHVVGRGHDLGADGAEVVVGDGGARARVAFDEDGHVVHA